jgi:hypothetical protein
MVASQFRLRLLYTGVGAAAFSVALAWGVSIFAAPRLEARDFIRVGETDWACQIGHGFGRERVRTVPFVLPPQGVGGKEIDSALPQFVSITDLWEGGSVSIENRQTEYLATGWPWRCMVGSAVSVQKGPGNWLQPRHPGYPAPRPVGALLLPHGAAGDALEVRILPLQPLWAGLAANTVVFGVAWLVALELIRSARRKSRRRHGRCVACGHELRDLATCPECGTTGAA